jgi:hypothetical protein
VDSSVWFGYGQSSDHFDSGALQGFTKSNIEHMIVEIGPPFKVRDVHGSILVSANNQPLAGSLFEIRDQSGTIRSATADKAGHFQIRGVPDGTFDFKTTKDGFQSVIGKLVAAKSTRRKALIEISMPIGI